MANTYYVKNSGNDGLDGLSDANAWQTINKVNISSFSAGDTILFNKGDIWREQLTVPSSGSVGNPIIFSSYGSGNKPKIYGSTAPTPWTNQGSNHWSATLATLPSSVWFVDTDGTTVHWGTKRTFVDLSELTVAYDWTYNGTTLYVYSTSDPATAYSSIEASARPFAIGASTKDYINITGLELAYPSQSCINTRHSSGNAGTNWIIDGIEAHHAGIINDDLSHLILIQGSDSVVRNSLLHDGGQHAIYVKPLTGAAANNTLIEKNIIYNNYHSGIDIQSQSGTNSGTIVRYNKLYNTSAYADTTQLCHSIYLQGLVTGGPFYVTNANIYYNVVYDAMGNGIMINSYATNINIYNNTVYRANTLSTNAGGIVVGATGTSSITIKNNISVDAGKGTGNNFSVASTVSSTVDYNLWYMSAGGTAVYAFVNGTSYHFNDQATYKSNTGYDTNGLWQDPLFISTASLNLHLQITSPCRDAGVNLGLTQDFDGNTVPQRTNPSIGAFESIFGRLAVIKKN